MDLKEYLIGFLLCGLFIICIFGFIVSFTADNTPVSDFNDGGIDISALEGLLNQSEQQSNEYQSSFSQENPQVASDSLIFFSILGDAKLMMSAGIDIAKILFYGVADIIGLPPLVIGILMAILLVSMIFAIWKMIKTGQ